MSGIPAQDQYEKATTASMRPIVHGSHPEAALSERAEMVLRALVAAYVGQAQPVASQALADLIPTRISSASVRNTLAELQEAGLVAKAHASSGRIPTERGLSLFIANLLELPELGPHHQRLLDRALEGVDAAQTPRQTSQILSDHTRQLGFVVAPRVERLRLRSVHLVPVSSDRVLAVLVAESGAVIQRILAQPEPLAQRELERVGALLAERVAGRTLISLRRLLESEQSRLRHEADDLMRRAWVLGLAACQGEVGDDDLVIATRLALLDQPEFADPERIRGLFSALETNQQLLALLRQIARTDRNGTQVDLSISLGAELGEPSLRGCALIAVPYGLTGTGRTTDASGEEEALGVLGVIGPQRMDYGKVIPLVSYCSELMTRKLQA
jgi:heat-inducible transcriptional repressor